MILPTVETPGTTALSTDSEFDMVADVNIVASTTANVSLPLNLNSSLVSPINYPSVLPPKRARKATVDDLVNKSVLKFTKKGYNKKN